MGLDTTHNCWHGAYSAFMRWRQEIAKAAGLPPLDLMEGFWNPPESRSDYRNPIYWARKGLNDERAFQDISLSLPIRWDCLKPDPIHELLHHSDCDGEIPWESCNGIADSLERLLPNLPKGDWRDKTQQFIDGLRLASSKQENVEFH